MSTIKIADLHFSGSDLLQDNESYLNELDNLSLDASQIQGGLTPVPVVSIVTATVITAISVVTRIAKEINEIVNPCPPPPCEF
uniref:Uncharacterized protein n=1 Tax=Synechocystis sp. PCC 9413 TaxID=77760 RepID=A0A2P0ZGH3_9SYNC|nr:hypothetical protein [Synechocystis sp. PCC 9413]